MDRRIFGLETEYGVTCTYRGQRRLSPDEVARYLFRRVVSWGRSSNVFLRNGARLYLDVGSHPEYATPECDSVTDLVVHDRAGERILEGLLVDAERYRRLHVIVGDSNMNEVTTLLKVGSADIVLRMIEAGVVMRDLTLENPIRAIREVSHDITGRRKVRLANGKEASALDIQHEYFSKAADFVDRRGGDATAKRVVELWGRVLNAVESANLATVDRGIDWITKLRVIERYQQKNDLPLAHPRIAQMDLAYHDLRRNRGLYALLEKRGQVDRIANDVEIFEAKETPPQTTRARLRGEFIRHAQEKP